MDYDARLKELGIELPDFSVTPYYGPSYGTMKSHHLAGNLLFLSGHVPEYPDGKLLYPGIVGRDITIEQAYRAAKLAGINALAGMKYALGDLNRVVSIVNSLNFVRSDMDFTEGYKVSSGSTDLLVEVFGKDIGLGGRATVGVTNLSRGHCFENWVTVQIRP